jgi:hypothetical protein
MCGNLQSLRQSILDFGATFDVSTLSPARALEVARACALMESSIASMRALAAARAADSGAWRQEGYRSAADQLAHDAGLSPSRAKRVLDTGRRLAEYPDVAKAALSGEISADKAAVVAEGASANPARAIDLLDKAKQTSMPELLEEVTRVKAEATDLEVRRRGIHGRRSLRRWTDTDGAFRAHLYGLPEDGAALWRALDPIRRRLLLLRRKAGSRESLDSLDYDAIMTLASVVAGADSELSLSDLVELGLFPQMDSLAIEGHALQDSAGAAGASPTSRPPGDSAAGKGAVSKRKRVKKLAGSPARVLIRVDLDALLRGVPIEGEACEITGYGPVPVNVIEELIANTSPFIVGVLTRGQQVVGVYHHGRHPNVHQSSALDFLYPTCAVKGCSARAGLQSDHRVDWARTRYTILDLLDRLCPHHHRLKTNQGWALVEGQGKRDFVPPGHPQHPGRSDHPDPVTRAGRSP